MNKPFTIEAMSVSQAARTLVRIAAARGLVLTIERVPLQPLAMGHATNRITVRPSRKTQQHLREEAEERREAAIWQEITDECGGQP